MSTLNKKQEEIKVNSNKLDDQKFKDIQYEFIVEFFDDQKEFYADEISESDDEQIESDGSQQFYKEHYHNDEDYEEALETSQYDVAI